MSLDSSRRQEAGAGGMRQEEQTKAPWDDRSSGAIRAVNYPSKRPAVCSCLLPPFFLLPRCGRRSFFLSLAQLHDPQAGVNVVEIDQPVLRLRAPTEGQVGAIALRVSGPEATDFASLPIQIAAQLA